MVPTLVVTAATVLLELFGVLAGDILAQIPPMYKIHNITDKSIMLNTRL